MLIYLIRLVKTFDFTVDQLVSWSSYWKIKGLGNIKSLGSLLSNSLKGEGFWGIKTLAIPGKIQKSVKPLRSFSEIFLNWAI